ncbi:DMT family transporter [Dietzia sp.]|uniref:DMT family transporter n=1 Tax=Dietzia sp. TaxID=1871616 RepID=UPI002FDB28FC
MPPTVLAIALALLSALATAFGMVLRHAAAEAPDHGESGAHAAIKSIFDWRWLGGTISSLVGFALQAAALNFGSLLMVQPITVLSLMFTLPLASRFSDRPATRTEWVWATVLTACVGALVVYGRPIEGAEHPAWWEWAIAVAAGLLVMGALGKIARQELRRDRAMLLGVAGGIAFAYVAVFAKGLVTRINSGGLLGVVTSGEVYGLVAAAVLALTVQQASFASGNINQAAPASTVTTPVVSIALGLFLLGERFSVSGWELVIIAAIITAMAAATVFLSRAAET